MAHILIDNLSPNRKFAWTTSTEKITYNRNLLRSIPFMHSVKVEGIHGEAVSLFAIGKYISVVRITSEGLPDKMYFFDHTWDISQAELQLLLQGVFTEEVGKEWFNIQWNLYSTFKPETDIVELWKG